MKKIILCLLMLSLFFSLLLGCQKQEVSSMFHIASYETLEDLTDSIQEANQKQANDEKLTDDDEVLVALEKVYKPAVDIADYTMYKIDVSKYYIRYWYRPNDIENPVPKELLYYTFRLPRKDVDQFAQVVEQYREQKQIEVNEDGMLYDPENQDVTFPMETSFGYVTVPESMNQYETILPLCQYEILEIPEA